MQKLQHENFNASQDARCCLKELTVLNIFCCLNDMKKIILDLNTQKGLEIIKHLGKMNDFPPCLM